MVMSLTHFIPETDLISDILEGVDPEVKKNIMLRLDYLTKIDHKSYGYVITYIPLRMLIEMIKKDGLEGHLLYNNLSTNKLETLTIDTINDKYFRVGHQKNKGVSGIYVISYEAMAVLIKKLCKKFSSKK
jgi:hypothetical protein